jgi:hypothetical protein
MEVGDGDRSRLPAFFALAFAWSWTCWLLAPAIKARSALVAGVLSGPCPRCKRGTAGAFRA